MIGLLTIGLIGLALCKKKRSVSGVGHISRFEWNVYRDLIDEIENALNMHIEDNARNLYYGDELTFKNPRLDISVLPGSRSGYDFEVIIDEYENFKYPNKTYDVSSMIELDEDGDEVIDYYGLENVVFDFLDNHLQKVAGIGAAYKRRIYYEINRLQPVVDFILNYDDQTEVAKKAIEDLYNTYYKEIHPNRKPITPERYYKQLKRAYNAISGIGKTELPYQESVVKNGYGDVILIHRDYGTPEEKLVNAKSYIEDLYIDPGTDDYKIGYWATVLGIANGVRFVWKSNKQHRGIEQLIFGTSVPTEKKLRISYIANADKGGLWPERYAESMLQYSLGGDDQEILDGVLDAIREIYSSKQAKEIIMDEYMSAHVIEDREEKYDNDLPF